MTDDLIGYRMMRGGGAGTQNMGPDFIVQARLRYLGTKRIVNNEERQGGRNVCEEF